MNVPDIPDDLSSLLDIGPDEAHDELDIAMVDMKEDLYDLKRLSVKVAKEVRKRIMENAPADDLIDSNIVCMSIQTNADIIFNIAVSLNDETLWRVDVMANPPCDCEDHCESE